MKMNMIFIGIALLGVSLFVLPAWGAESMMTDTKLDISKMTCKDLMSGNDSDRDASIAYFHGYLAGKKNNNILDVTTASTLTDKVRDYCLSNPTSTVMNAFKKSAD